jgi:hypothetical protein
LRKWDLNFPSFEEKKKKEISHKMYKEKKKSLNLWLYKLISSSFFRSKVLFYGCHVKCPFTNFYPYKNSDSQSFATYMINSLFDLNRTFINYPMRKYKGI